MSKKIELYTWGHCPYCIRAKSLLDSKDLKYTEISLDGKNEDLMALRERTGHRTVPQIFIDDQFVGGFSELSELDTQGKL